VLTRGARLCVSAPAARAGLSRHRNGT